MATPGFVDWRRVDRFVLVDGRDSAENRAVSRQRESVGGFWRAIGVEFLVEFNLFPRSTSRFGSGEHCGFSRFNCGHDLLHPSTRSRRRQSTDTLSTVGSFRHDVERQHRLPQYVNVATEINSRPKNERTRRQMGRCYYEAWLI